MLGNTYSLEQRLQLSDDNLASRGPSGGGGTGASTYGERSQSGKGNAIHGLLTHDKGESLLLNLLLPLCLKVGSGRKDAPKMRPQDVKFSLNLLLSLLNPLKGMLNVIRVILHIFMLLKCVLSIMLLLKSLQGQKI